MATCSAQDLLTAGACFECLTKKELQIVIAQLLCEISEGGGSGGVGAVMRGSGAPVAAPASPLAGAIYYDDDAASPSYDVAWHWSVPLQIWIGA
jgi:hypothetical protein